MDYRVAATDPLPPARGVAWVGGLSALALAASPTLVWWFFDAGLGLSIGGQPAPRLTSDHLGTQTVFGKLLLFFSLICLVLWVQYARSTKRWMRPLASLLLIALGLICSLVIIGVLAYAVLLQTGLPGLSKRAVIGSGLYLALGSSIVQCCCLFLLVQERIAWAKMLQGRE